jgi:anaerobic selenocysteine-containing dehydrogenase
VTHEVRSFCRFCQALCGIVVTVDGGGPDGDVIVDVRGDEEHPLSRGYVCPKGRALGAWHHHPDRLDVPVLRTPEGGAVVERRVDWTTALGDLGMRLRAVIDEVGPDGVGIFFGTGSSFDSAGGRGAFAWFSALGSRSRYTARSIDTPCRPLVSDLVGGHPGLVPAIDLDTTTLLVLVGTNPVVSHGHLASFPDPVRRLRHLTADGREVWVLDPRRTESARLATRHLAVRPGSDHAVLAHVIRELLGPGGGADRRYLVEHADGVGRLADAVARFDAPTAAGWSGLTEDELADLVAAVRRHRRLVVVTGTGTSMSRSANATEWLARALQVVTGSPERPGGPWYNPGVVRGMDQRRHRASGPDVADVPGPRSRPELSGRYGELPCVAMADEIEAGNLRALVVVGGNLVTAFPGRDRLTAALGRLDVLACVDVVATETTALATHVLPAAGQLERADVPDYVDQYQGLVASQHTAAVVPPGGDRRPVWWIFGALGTAMGLAVLPKGIDLATATDDDYLRTMLARARIPFDDLVAAPTGVVAAGPQCGWVEAGVLPDGRWRVAPPALVAQLEALEPEPAVPSLPLRLVVGRGMRTLNSALRDVGARRPPDPPLVALHPADAAAHGVAAGDAVEVRSRHGACTGTAVLDDGLRPGVVHVPHGWGDPAVTRLVDDTADVDVLTGMPTQTGVAVAVRPLSVSPTGGASARP